MTQPPPYDASRFRDFEREGWNTVGSGYHDAFSPLTRQAVEPLLDGAGVGHGTRLLDVASGPGHVAGAAARRGAKAVGLDLAPAMVADARRRYPGVEFREGDASALPFPDESFDAVTIGFGILHFADPDRALAETRRVLAPGGRVAFTVWDAPERAVTFGLALTAVERYGDPGAGLPPGPPFFRFADAQEAKRALIEAGYADPQVRTLPIAWRVPSTEALLEAFLKGAVRTRALLLAQSPQTMAAIRAGMTEMAEPYRRDGELELPTPAVLTSAVRPSGGDMPRGHGPGR